MLQETCEPTNHGRESVFLARARARAALRNVPLDRIIEEDIASTRSTGYPTPECLTPDEAQVLLGLWPECAQQRTPLDIAAAEAHGFSGDDLDNLAHVISCPFCMQMLFVMPGPPVQRISEFEAAVKALSRDGRPDRVRWRRLKDLFPDAKWALPVLSVGLVFAPSLIGRAHPTLGTVLFDVASQQARWIALLVAAISIGFIVEWDHVRRHVEGWSFRGIGEAIRRDRFAASGALVLSIMGVFAIQTVRLDSVYSESKSEILSKAVQALEIRRNVSLSNPQGIASANPVTAASSVISVSFPERTLPGKLVAAVGDKGGTVEWDYAANSAPVPATQLHVAHVQPSSSAELTAVLPDGARLKLHSSDEVAVKPGDVVIAETRGKSAATALAKIQR